MRTKLLTEVVRVIHTSVHALTYMPSFSLEIQFNGVITQTPTGFWRVRMASITCNEDSLAH
jgi:hypothetical protein